MRRKLFGLMSAGALIAGASVLVAAGPASAGPAAEPGPSVDVNIDKVVHGDDPGVAFPIVLTCTSVTTEETPFVQDDINLGQNDIDSFTVHLKDGESETVTVQLPPLEPDSVTCEVTEDVSDADLPTGWECTPDIDPAEFTLFERDVRVEQEIPDEVDVTVENDCTEPPATTTTTAPVSPPQPPPVKPIVAVARYTG